MKKSNLFKRLGALLTAVAVMASMGTVAFADGDDGTITINTATIAPTDDVVNGEGVYEVTVEYEAQNVGPMGVTMLAYAKGEGTPENTPELEAAPGGAGAGFTQYTANYKIAYVTQEAPALTEGAGTLSFKIDTTGEDAIEVGAGEKILILLGGDNVLAPASALVTTYWNSTATAALKAGDSAFGGLGSALTVDLDSTTIEEALETALAAYTVYVQDEKGNSAAVAWEDVDIAVEEAEGDEITHKATLTVDKDVAIDGVNNDVDAVYEFNFAADLSWTADTLTISKTEYTIYGSDLEGTVDGTAIATALKAAVLAETITAGKRDTTLGAEVGTATKETNVTVEIKSGVLNEVLTGADAAADVAFVVTLAANTDLGNGVTVDAEGAATEITLDYIVTRPTEWTVASAEYIGTAIPNIKEAQAAGYDFAAYAEAELEGKAVTLADGNGNTVDVVLGTDVEFTVSAAPGEPDGSDIATVTVTVTIAAKTWTEGGVTEITIPAEPAITFNTTFTSKMETVKYGDVNEDTVVDMGDAILIWQYELEKTSLTAKQLKAANVNGDDGVDMGDAILIWQYELEKISSFPVEQ